MPGASGVLASWFVPPFQRQRARQRAGPRRVDTASFGLTAQVANLVFVSALWLVVSGTQIAILRTQNRLQEMAVMFARGWPCAS